MPPDDGNAATPRLGTQTSTGKPGTVIPAKVPQQQPILKGLKPGEVMQKLFGGKKKK